MKPSELASALYKIASGIERSKNPSRQLVSRDLRSVLAAMDENQVDINHTAKAIQTALQNASSRDPEDRIGEQFPVEDDKLWKAYGVEVVLEFPDDGDTVHITALIEGDGEPVGYSSPVESFSSTQAAEQVIQFLKTI